MPGDKWKYERPTPFTRVELALAREQLRQKLCPAVHAAWEMFRLKHNLPVKWLSIKLRRNNSNMHRAIQEPEDWSLDTIAEILAAIGADLEFEIVWKEEGGQ